MLVNSNPINFNVKKVENDNINTKVKENKTENIKLSSNSDNIKIGVASKLSTNEAKISTPIKLYSDTDKIKTQRSVASGLIGVAISGSAIVMTRQGYQLGSSFGTKGAITGAVIAGTTGALLAGATAGAVDDRIFSSMKSVGVGGAVAGALFATSHSIHIGLDIKTSAILIGAGAVAGAGMAMGAAYAGGSNHKPLF